VQDYLLIVLEGTMGQRGRPPKKKRTPADIPFKEVKNHLLKCCRNINLPATRHSVMTTLLMWWTFIENNDADREKKLWEFIEVNFMNKKGQVQWRDDDEPKKLNSEGERIAESKDAKALFDNITSAWAGVLSGGKDNASNIQSATSGCTELSDRLDT
jgi:hypothetical protein